MALLFKTTAQHLWNAEKEKKKRYHGGEQQSHEKGPCDQDEDDEDADDFIQRSLQPHNHLRTQRGGGGRNRGVGGRAGMWQRIETKSVQFWKGWKHAVIRHMEKPVSFPCDEVI